MLAWLISACLLGVAAPAEPAPAPASSPSTEPAVTTSSPPSPVQPVPTWNMVHRGPRVRYFNPPAGLYLLGDGSQVHADPPRGYYDRPPGYYPRDRAQALAFGNSLGPLPTPLSDQDRWLAKRIRLRVGLGISGAALGIAVVTPIITSIIIRAAIARDPEYFCIDCWDPGILVLMGLGPPAVIATTVYAIRLGLHSRRRPVSDRVSFGAGGLGWRF